MGVDRQIDITANQRKTLLALLKRRLPNTTAWVYGSRAKWTSRPQSDLDLVVFTKPEQERRVSELREAFEESNLPFRVDLFVWDAVPEQFRKQIEAEHVVLVEREEQGVAGGWREMTLGSLLSFSNGQASPARSDDLPYPVYGSNGIIGFSDETNAASHTIVVGRVGSYCGSLHYSDRTCWVTDNAIRANAINENSARFLFYLLETLRLNDRRAGSGQPLLNQTILSSIPVVIPEPPEQRAIAHILGSLDDKIELNRRMNETLEAMAQALFKSWFIDFDPVRAKMEGRDPGLPQYLADLFPDRLVDSELGLIPEGWEVKTLGECFNLTMGQSPPGNTYNEQGEGLPFFQGRTDFAFRYPENRKFCTAPTRIAQPRDTLVSVRAPVGDVNMAWEQCCIGRGIAALRHKTETTSYSYYFTCMIQSVLREYEHTGTVFGAINKNQFETLRVLEPDEKSIAAFDSCAQYLDARIKSSIAESRVLVALRDALLPKLISGKLRVRPERFANHQDI